MARVWTTGTADSPARATDAALTRAAIFLRVRTTLVRTRYSTPNLLMLQPPFRSILLGLTTLLATPATTGILQASGAPTPVFETWLRVASQLDQPLADFAKRWPRRLSREEGQSSFALTPADRLVVAFAASAAGPDSTQRVARVTLIERVPDSLALRNAARSAQQRLVASFGAPDTCSGAPGDPSHLFAPQETSRIWTRGVGGAVTRLTWEVTATREYVLTISAGRYAADDAETYSCAARLP